MVVIYFAYSDKEIVVLFMGIKKWFELNIRFWANFFREGCEFIYERERERERERQYLRQVVKLY